MKNRSLLRVVAISGAIFLFSQIQAAACPCSPCKCLPCTCGGGHSGGGGGGKGKEGGGGGGKSKQGGGGKSKQGGGGKHGGKGGGHHKGHRGGHGGSSSSIGVGINVDLSGIGRRNAEPDPFAAGGPPANQPVTQSTEKKKPKTQDRKITTPNAFDDVKLTGQEAKDVGKDSEDLDDMTQASDTSGLEIADRTGDSTGTTQEKPEKKGKKKKLKEAVAACEKVLDKAWEVYINEKQKIYDKSPHYQELNEKYKAAYKKAHEPNATEAAKAAMNKAMAELNKQAKALDNDYHATPEGQKALAAIKEANKALEQAKMAEKGASKVAKAAK